MDGSLWRQVVQDLRTDHRCLVPTMPLGSHRRPMRADADLSPHGIAKLQAEFLQALDLREVTLVGNDSGIFLLTAGRSPERLARLVITPCESFENVPPGLPGRTAALGLKLPGGAFLQEWLARLQSGDLKYDALTLDEVKVRVYNEAALVICRQVQEAAYRGNPIMAQLRTTLVFVQHQGQWQLAGLHMCNMGQPPPFARS
jgi:pimeloyl-ACP methyl ester carboxylesterase